MRTLEGLLPVCAHCKAIRDDDGVWMRVDAYVIKHTPANISHGIYPECAAKLHPEIDLTIGKKKPTSTPH